MKSVREASRTRRQRCLKDRRLHGSALAWRRGPCRRLSSPAGLTLLELLLALALTTFVLAAISMAINLSLRALDVRRTDVEESQLAQTLLQLMARDLRNAVRTPLASGEIDLQSLVSGDSLDELDQTGELGELLGETDGLTESGDSQDIAGSTTVPPTLGLYGTQYELQVDVSRVPRVEEYQQFVAPDEAFSLNDIPGGVKTVAYYLLAPGTLSSAGVKSFNSQLGLAEDDLQQGGLVRRELDRAVSLYAAESGGISGSEAGAELIAPEVTDLEFRYFDGSLGWITEWDSEAQGRLPLAVEIVIAIRSGIDAEAQATAPTTIAPGNASYSGDVVFRLVVPLPAGKAPCEESGESGDLTELGL